MASIYVLTALPLDTDGEHRLYQALSEAVAPTFSMFSLMVKAVPAPYASCGAANKTVAFVCVPPSIDGTRKKAVARQICGAVKPFAHGADKPDVLVLFPYHTSDCCGKHGVMRCDAEASREK